MVILIFYGPINSLRGCLGLLPNAYLVRKSRNLACFSPFIEVGNFLAHDGELLAGSLYLVVLD